MLPKYQFFDVSHATIVGVYGAILYKNIGDMQHFKKFTETFDGHRWVLLDDVREPYMTHEDFENAIEALVKRGVLIQTVAAGHRFVRVINEA